MNEDMKLYKNKVLNPENIGYSCLDTLTGECEELSILNCMNKRIIAVLMVFVGVRAETAEAWSP